MSDYQPSLSGGAQYNGASSSQLEGSDAQREQQANVDRKARLDAVLTQFWRDQMSEVDRIRPGPDCSELKNHPLPLARIKKIMKTDEDVRMISAEAPVVFAKACELFILELTHRAWAYSEDNKRRTLQRNDVAAAIADTDVLDFLLDVIPLENADGSAMMASTSASLAAPTSSQAPAQMMAYAMPGHGAGASGAAQTMPQASGAMGQQMYVPYMQWPGMAGAMPGGAMASGVPVGVQQQQSGMPAGMVMDPKMQAHMQHQMSLAQQQYMQRQMQRPQHVRLPTQPPHEPPPDNI